MFHWGAPKNKIQLIFHFGYNGKERKEKHCMIKLEF